VTNVINGSTLHCINCNFNAWKLWNFERNAQTNLRNFMTKALKHNWKGRYLMLESYAERSKFYECIKSDTWK